MSCIHLSRIQPTQSADGLLFLGFNQDFSCIAAGVKDGFRIFNCDPYRETFKRAFAGSIGIVEMLFRCNILAIVGGDPEPAFSKTKVILWDDNQSSPIGELAFKADVKAVKLRREKIVVVLENYVYVYNFDKLERIRKYDTCPNQKGLVALSPVDECVLAFPHTAKGVVRVELLDSDKSHLINAHDSTINCISLNQNGSRLATASEKGTLIRIFDTYTGAKLQEVRRGTEKADIYSIAFSPDSRFFCTSSDKGTIHIFALNSETQGANNNGESENSVEPLDTSGGGFLRKWSSTNRKSKMSFIGGYFSSEWSFSWFRGPECPSICCFGQDSATVIVFTAEGSHYKLSFDTEKGGECTRCNFSRFLKADKN